MTKKQANILSFALLAMGLLAFRLFRSEPSPPQAVREALRAPTASPTSKKSSPTLDNAVEGKADSMGGLPAVLVASIETELPGYSLPEASAGNHAYASLCQTRISSPFYSVGDFTGHGRQEFALILTTGPEKLRFAIFSPDATGKFILVLLAR